MNEESGTFIETFFPEEKLSRAGRREKKGRPRTFEMHYWWSRKPLVVARAALLGAILPFSFPPDKFEELVGLHAQEAPYKTIIPKNQSCHVHDLLKDRHGRSISILDPFAGGGSLPFAALELGLDVTANDYNPVAWLILKATLEFPGKYGQQLKVDIDQSIENVMHYLETQLGQFYPPHAGKVVDAYLYTWMVTCPQCNRPTPLVGKWQVAKYPDQSRTVFIDPSWNGDTWAFHLQPGEANNLGSCARATGKCLHPDCGAIIPNGLILSQFHAGVSENLMITILHDSGPEKYRTPAGEDLTAITLAKQALKNERPTFQEENLIPVEEMPLHTIRAAKYLKYWHALFNPRQLLFFAHFVRAVRMESKRVVLEHGSGYGQAIGAYLALFIGKLLDYNCRLTSWIPTREGILHACSNKLNALQWDHAEINPFSGGSGSMTSARKAILNGLSFAIEHVKQARVEITNQSLFTLGTQAYDLILTDPPYFDDAPYSELSEFFHVWESRAIGHLFKDLNPSYSTTLTPKAEDLSVSFQRRADNFDTAFTKACMKMETLLHNDGILVLFFAHTDLDAWTSVTRALQSARFRITAAWPVHTENVGISNWSKDSIYSSVILIARKRLQDKIGIAKELDPQIQFLLERRLEDLWKIGFRGADLVVSGIGATLGVFTQYTEIRDSPHEFNLKSALQRVKDKIEQFLIKKNS